MEKNEKIKIKIINLFGTDAYTNNFLNTNLISGIIFKDSKKNKRIIAFSKKNGVYLKDFRFHEDDILLFGREDTGLPNNIINASNSLISIFMPKVALSNNDPKGVRSLNLSVACGIAIYEAYKQINSKNAN